MRGLKITIGVMSTLIVVALVLVVVGISQKSKKLSVDTVADITLPVPKSAQLQSVNTTSDKVVLHLRENGQDKVYILSETGTVLGTITLSPDQN